MLTQAHPCADRLPTLCRKAAAAIVAVLPLAGAATPALAATATGSAARAWALGSFDPAPAMPGTPADAGLAASGPLVASLLGPTVAGSNALIRKTETRVAWVRKEVVPPPVPTAFQPGTPGTYSGLPWHSGAACSGADFAQWRGRALDMEVGWAPKSNWADFVNFSANLRYIANRPTWFTIGLPMLTAEVAGQFANAASGAFDTYYQQFAQNMVDLNMGDSIIRIGWEANGNWYPWAANGQVEAYKATFQRIAGIFKAASPDFKIEWSNARKGNVLPVTQMYPGDDVVDFVGVSYYDRFKHTATQADWKAGRDQKIAGGPVGIGAWLGFAKAHKKFLSVSEWGVNNGYDQGAPMGVAGDDPIFVSNMYAFFRANARYMAYEDYFNCPQSNSGEYYQVFPSTYNPRSSAVYQKLWMGGS